MEDVHFAEQSLVALLALEPARIGEVSGWLSPSDFGIPAAGLLYGRLLELGDRPAEPGALLAALRGRGELRSDGFPVSALMRWWEAMPAPGHPVAWGRLVVEGQVARQLWAAGTRLAQVAATGGPRRALSMLLVQRATLSAASRRLAQLPGGAPAPAHAAPVAAEPVPNPAACPAELEEAELVTAGAVMLSPAAGRVARWLTPADFASPEIGSIFATAIDMQRAGRPTDRVTVTAELRARGGTTNTDVVARCEAAVPVTASVGFYARRVLAASVLRQVNAAGVTLARLGDDRPGGTAAAVNVAIDRLDALAPLAARLRMALTPTTPTSTASASRVVDRSLAFEPARR